ncbi:MAG: cyclase family protein [Peptococcaceae bacterium]|nr:cyclase family protein [Peptococcaceae bacterium]
MKVIDLSHAISESMPCYPGTGPPSFAPASTIERDGFTEKRITLLTHTGTHLDAPAHIFPGAATLDRIAPENFCGPAAVLDFTGFRRRTVGPADLEPHRPAVEKSEFVLLRTGWSKLWGSGEYFRNFPVLSPEGARWFRGFNLKGLGVDAVSVDALENGDFPVHKILLQRGLIIVENLTNLDSLPENGFHFCCFPLKLEGADGSPVRAVAVTGL